MKTGAGIESEHPVVTEGGLRQEPMETNEGNRAEGEGVWDRESDRVEKQEGSDQLYQVQNR